MSTVDKNRGRIRKPTFNVMAGLGTSTDRMGSISPVQLSGAERLLDLGASSA
jgi:hypothetical protein